MAGKHKLNRNAIKFLKSICDEGSFYLRKKTGHPVTVATYGGHERSFVLWGTPNAKYQNVLRYRLKRFIRSLPIDQDQAIQQIHL